MRTGNEYGPPNIGVLAMGISIPAKRLRKIPFGAGDINKTIRGKVGERAPGHHALYLAWGHSVGRFRNAP